MTGFRNSLQVGSRLTALALFGTGAAAMLFIAERRRPLRRQTQSGPRRIARNLVMGAMSTGVVAALQRPIVDPLSRGVERRRLGIAQQLPAPALARDAVAFLSMDYTI